jgi:DNA-binding CsgD family transcriptional regulator
MRINKETAAKAYVDLFEGIPQTENVFTEFTAEQDQEIILNQLRFAEKLFPKSGYGLCPINHTMRQYSESCGHILGHPFSEIVKWSLADFLSFVHPEDLPSIQHCFVFIKKFSSTDPEMHRFTIQFRFRTKNNEYQHLRIEQVAIKTRENRYLYLMLYSNISEDEKFYHVKLDVYKKINGNYLKTYTYNPQQQEKAITPRQNDIAKLVIRGFNNQEIADQLGVSVYTVKNHKQILFRKVNVKNSIELANYVNRISAGN